MIHTFAGWIEGFPTWTDKAEEVVKNLLHEIIPRFGLPRSLQSDDGTSFTSKVTQGVSKAFSSVQFRSVAQSCPTLHDPVNRSTPGLPVHHQLLEFTQTHVHHVGDAIQTSHPLSSPSSPAPNPSQHQGLFQRINSSHEVLEFQLHHVDIHSCHLLPLPICLDSWTCHSRFLFNIALYSIGLYFYPSHPQLGFVFALAPSLPSFWSYFSTDLQ